MVPRRSRCVCTPRAHLRVPPSWYASACPVSGRPRITVPWIAGGLATRVGCRRTGAPLRAARRDRPGSRGSFEGGWRYLGKHGLGPPRRAPVRRTRRGSQRQHCSPDLHPPSAGAHPGREDRSSGCVFLEQSVFGWCHPREQLSLTTNGFFSALRSPVVLVLVRQHRHREGRATSVGAMRRSGSSR
jgi:hypothetical protein